MDCPDRPGTHALALIKRWDEGRDQFTAAEELDPDFGQDYCYLARKVIFEAKAGQAGRSDRATLGKPRPALSNRHPSGWHSRSSRSGIT